MPNEVKLLPCPFCGREPISTDHGALVFHQIAPCPLSKQHFDVRIWNHRPTTLVTDEVVERDKLIEALTPSAETKTAYIGEFSFTVMDRDDDGEEIPRRVLVPWDTTKEIMAAIRNRALASMPTVVTGEQSDMDQALAAILAKDDTEVMLDELRELFGADLDVDSRFTIAQVMTAMESSFERGKDHIQMVNRAMTEAKARSAQPGDA